MQGMNPVTNRASTIDVPVRILVPSESVGAIIGKGGQTIRTLTQQTRAKVDVYRGDPLTPATALQEKIITIRGQPENCINACREILKVMKTDAENKNKPSDIPLKVLAHNDYIGRIIGKQGNIINTIKKDTDTTVTVSSINDMSMNVERVITVKGELENMIKALEIIHQKIKSAFENDTKTFGAQAIMMGGIPPLPMAPPYAPYNPPTARFPGQPATTQAAAAAAAAAAYQNFYPAIYPQFFPQSFVAPPPPQQQQQQQQHGGPSAATSAQNIAQHAAQQHASNAAPTQPQLQQPSGGGPHQQQQQQNSSQQQQQQPQQQQQINSNNQSYYQCDIETVHLYIPSAAVGAIIGTKGQYIKNIIKLSGASVKITPVSNEESKNAAERQVVIIGNRTAQWNAQYYIYEKIRQERFVNEDNVKLRTELQVPPQIVGRIIGKNGANVRDLQRATGATIKLPEDANQTQSNFVIVRILGTFSSSQLAQQRIQQLIAQGSRGRGGNNQQNMMSNSASGGIQLQNVSINQTHNNINRQTNGGNRKPHRQQYQQQQQNGPSSQQPQQQQSQPQPQQQQQQQQSGNNTANTTPTATTPTSQPSESNQQQQQQPPSSGSQTPTPTQQQQQQQQPQTPTPSSNNNSSN